MLINKKETYISKPKKVEKAEEEMKEQKEPFGLPSK